MGRRSCPRGWIRGATEKGGGAGLSNTVTLERKPWGETIITLHTPYSRRERHEMVSLAERACFLL